MTRDEFDDDLAQAIAGTEQEIFAEATGGASPEEMEDNDALIDQFSQMHDLNDDAVADRRLAREAVGAVPPGMTLAFDDEDAQAPYDAGRAAAYREIASQLPQPERRNRQAACREWGAQCCTLAS
jgi:hypothetical protein